MLRFIVMRHAKSVPATVDLPDHQRSLTARGRRDALGVARAIATLGWSPQRVLSSDSRRTRETWERMIEAFAESPEVRFDRQLYLPSVDDFESVVLAQHGDVRTLLTLAHNSGCEDLVAHLTDAAVVMKTSYAVLLHTDAPTWTEAFRPGAFAIADVVGPPPRDS
ncbi:MAG: histidine phosphatase family protein [Myxococcota bacterium]